MSKVSDHEKLLTIDQNISSEELSTEKSHINVGTQMENLAVDFDTQTEKFTEEFEVS